MAQNHRRVNGSFAAVRMTIAGADRAAAHSDKDIRVGRFADFDRSEFQRSTGTVEDGCLPVVAHAFIPLRTRRSNQNAQTINEAAAITPISRHKVKKNSKSVPSKPMKFLQIITPT